MLQTINEKNAFRGEVSIFDKHEDGNLSLIERKNLIVYQGRTWLLERAFGSKLEGAIEENYNKTLKWFGLGQGGGEPGNPIQAGATAPWHTDLQDPIIIKEDGLSPTYASKLITDVGQVNGYYKTFSTVYRKQDFSNSFILGNGEFYPELIAEIRVDIGKTEAIGITGSPTTYIDLNEAGLFFGDDTDTEDNTSTTSEFNIVKVEKLSDETTTRYILESGSNLNSPISYSVGDYIEVYNAEINSGTQGNNTEKTPILKMGSQLETDCKPYIDVTNATSQNYTYSSNYPVLSITKRQGFNKIALFSRVTFGTIRKTNNREITFLWRIYF